MLRKLLAARFLAIILMLCLPLQAAAALVMPIEMLLATPPAVMPGSSSSAEHSANPEHNVMTHCEHAFGDAASAMHDKAPADHAPANGSCDSCGLCHLASSAIAPLGNPVTPDLKPARAYTLPSAQRYASHVPEQPQRPPRAA